jgi:hypothetical protein
MTISRFGRRALSVGVAVALLAGCGGASHSASDTQAEVRGLGGWAESFNSDFPGLFTGNVSADSDGSTFKLATNAAVWDALSDDDKAMLKTKAEKAFETVYCLQSDNKGSLVGGTIIKFVDENSRDTLDYTVTGAGLDCR